MQVFEAVEKILDRGRQNENQTRSLLSHTSKRVAFLGSESKMVTTTPDQPRRLIVFGTVRDPHVARVVSAANTMGIQSIVVDYLEASTVTITHVRNCTPTITINNKTLQDDDLIWYRLKLSPGGPYYFDDTLPGEAPFDRKRRHSLCEQQWLATYNVMLALHKGKAVSQVNRYFRSVTKPAQQMIATRCGLLSPDYIVSNDKTELLNFAYKYESLITKPIAAVRLPRVDHAGSDPVMTSSVDLRELVDAPEASFQTAPMMLQSRIEKSCEVRVVATQQEIRAYSINSQQYDATQVDWRHGSHYLKFEPHALREGIEASIFEFLRVYNLDYGSFDFIVDSVGDYWFLECNPDGQWGWLEDERLPEISTMLARQFSRS